MATKKAIRVHSSSVEMIPLDDLRGYAKNSRKHSPDQIASIAAIIADSGFTNPLLIDKATGDIIAGHGRLEAARKLKMAAVPCITVAGLSPEQVKALRISDNATALQAGWDQAALLDEILSLKDASFDLDLLGFDPSELDEILNPKLGDGGQAGALALRFGIPPFSVLNAREGWWMERKAAWLSLGIKSEVGRGQNLMKWSDSIAAMKNGKAAAEARVGRKLSPEEFSGTSIFDPVMTELAVRWWCPPGGVILDPFAGGSVRGVVSGKLGRRYVGVDLRPEQIAANEAQRASIFAKKEKTPPRWIAGDSLEALPDIEADFILSCPPYADLEVYSDDPRDISTMAYADFIAVLGKIVHLACERLKDDRFACFVVGDVRDKRGSFRSFPQDTISAFRAAGLALYNDAILVTIAGSLFIRAGRQFAASRKLGATHQRVLVFVKGDGRKAANAVGAVEFGQWSPEEG